MSRFGRSLGTKLGLLVTLITAGAVAAIFFVVVPQLRARVENQRLTELERVAPAFTPLITGKISHEIKAPQLDRLVRSLADRSDAEVTLSEIQRRQGAPPAFDVFSNSRGTGTVDANRGLQVLASQTRRTQGAIVNGAAGRTAQVAVPLPFKHPVWVAVYTRDLSDVHGPVALFGNRVLIAGGIALLITLMGGYLVARRLARRVNNLRPA